MILMATNLLKRQKAQLSKIFLAAVGLVLYN